MGTHLRELHRGYQMSTNMTGFRWFQISLRSCALDESRLGIGRVKVYHRRSTKSGCLHIVENAPNFEECEGKRLLSYLAIGLAFDTSNAEATFVIRTRKHKYFENHLNAVLLIFIG